MEPIIHISDSTKGVEVLHFDQAEVKKVKGNTSSFAAFGSLSVLYFKDYDRFVLQLNDWRYPLIRRLPVSSVTGKDIDTSRSYVFPALNGFSFHLTITSTTHTQGLSNLDMILDHNSRFSSKGKESLRKLEASPDDKLVRHIKKDTGAKEVITETIKQVVQKVENVASTLTTGTKHLTSTKKRINLKDIKNKNFRKQAHSKINKDFFQSTEKLSSEFLQRRRDNLNNTQMKEYDELRKTSDHQAPVLYIPRVEIEEAILNNKDILSQSLYFQVLGVNVSENKTGLTTENRPRDTLPTGVQGTGNVPISGGLFHDQA